MFTLPKISATVSMLFVLFIMVPYGISMTNGSALTATSSIPPRITVVSSGFDGASYARVDYPNTNGMTAVLLKKVMPDALLWVHESCSNVLNRVDWSSSDAFVLALEQGRIVEVLGQPSCSVIQETWDLTMN